MSNIQTHMKKFHSGKAGFTLVELLVAMTITIILLGVLVYMTGVSTDTYRSNRSEIRASRQAKEALTAITNDFESMVIRRDGNAFEWLYAGEETSRLDGPEGREIPNTSRLIFFTAATDRYNGAVGGASDAGGDVSAVSYRLVYRDQISDTDDEEHAVFSLYRTLADPNITFDNILASESLESAYTSQFSDDADFEPSNFLVENIYEFSITFLIEVPVEVNGITVNHTVRATMSPDNYLREFRVSGLGINFEGSIEYPSGSGLTQDQVEDGTLAGVDIALTVLSDQGVTLAKRSGIKRADLIKKYGYHYTKSIVLPRP